MAHTEGPMTVGVHKEESAEGCARYLARIASHSSNTDIWMVFPAGDDQNDPRIVAVTGNGPTSEGNAYRVMQCLNQHDALVSAIKRAKGILNANEAGSAFQAYNILEGALLENGIE